MLDFYVTPERYSHDEKKFPITKTIDRPYPYVPYLTAIKVVQDWREECSVLIRGEDLLSEFSLYCHFCRLLNIPIPEFHYVPKLMQDNKDEIFDLSDVSKTKGNFKLRDYREKGYTKEQVINILEEACLIDKQKGWDYDNIKKNPIIYL
jgi:glutamyl/glutaminyl-tRNA synthetase